MNDSAVAKRYAQALMTLASDEQEREGIAKDLDLACDTIYRDDALRAVYTGVQFANADKKQAVTEIFRGLLGQNTIHFLLLLVDKMRTAHLADIRTAYHALLDESKGIADATVYSAFEMKDEEVQRLAEVLGQATGKTIRLQAETDPDLLAGIRIRYGDYVIDGSARARLEKLRAELTRDDKITEVRDR